MNRFNLCLMCVETYECACVCGVLVMLFCNWISQWEYVWKHNFDVPSIETW